MRPLIGGLFLSACFLAGAIMGPGIASAALSVDRSDMNAYADGHVCNGSDCRSGTFVSLGNDCTNFVSQVIRAGGFSDKGSWWYHKNGTPNNTNDDDWSFGWVRVTDWFGQFVEFAPYMGPIQVQDKSLAYTQASPFGGDIYIYDWGKGDGFSHLAYSPGYGTYPHFLVHAATSGSPALYLDTFDSAGDWIDQHSTDRRHAPWNWGYLTEDSPTYRAHQVFGLIPWRIDAPH